MAVNSSIANKEGLEDHLQKKEEKRMKRMKKWSALPLALMLLVMTLTACGGSNAAMDKGDSAASDSAVSNSIIFDKSETAGDMFFEDAKADGGSIDLTYGISIENTQAGVIDYHLDIRAK